MYIISYIQNPLRSKSQSSLLIQPDVSEMKIDNIIDKISCA